MDASEGWPEGRQTDSLRTALARMTEREAGDFLAHVRALVDDEQRANEEATMGDGSRVMGDRGAPPVPPKPNTYDPSPIDGDAEAF